MSLLRTVVSTIADVLVKETRNLLEEDAQKKKEEKATRNPQPATRKTVCAISVSEETRQREIFLSDFLLGQLKNLRV